MIATGPFTPYRAGSLMRRLPAFTIVQSGLQVASSEPSALMNSVLAKSECHASSVNTLTLQR